MLDRLGVLGADLGSRIRSARLVDPAIALGVLVLTAADARRQVEEGRTGLDFAVATALICISAAALAVRRRRPLAVLLTCMACQSAWYLFRYQGPGMNLPTMVALYTVGTQASRRTIAVVAAAVVLWSLVLVAVADESFENFVTSTGWALASLMLGALRGSQRALLEEHRERALLTEAQREVEARVKMEEERRRIARDLHDVVAHTVAAMNVHADVAIEALDRQPVVARQALEQVQASGRTAIEELGATVAILRDRSAVTAPPPDLSRIDDLARSAVAAGIAVHVTRTGDVSAVPVPVQLAAYRIVQEALTNVLRHADATTAEVALESRGSRFTVTVSDDGAGTVSADGAATAGRASASPDTANTGVGGGHGLVGIAERARAAGGDIEHGPLPERGFRVRATFPLGVRQ